MGFELVALGMLNLLCANPVSMACGDNLHRDNSSRL